MAPHPGHVFCSARFCVDADLHHALLAYVISVRRDPLPPLPERPDGWCEFEVESAWLRTCYQAEAEALEHFDTEVDTTSPGQVAQYLRGKVRAWLVSRRTRAGGGPRRRSPRRRVVAGEAA